MDLEGGALPAQAGPGPGLSEAQTTAAFAPLEKPLLIVAAAVGKLALIELVDAAPRKRKLCSCA